MWGISPHCFAVPKLLSVAGDHASACTINDFSISHVHGIAIAVKEYDQASSTSHEDDDWVRTSSDSERSTRRSREGAATSSIGWKLFRINRTRMRKWRRRCESCRRKIHSSTRSESAYRRGNLWWCWKAMRLPYRRKKRPSSTLGMSLASIRS